MPVITLVINFGSKRWDGPLSLYEMMPEQPAKVKAFVQDYKVFLIDPMAMTDADNGMTAIEVEVFLTLVVPYLAALTFYNINIEKRIYVVKFHVKSMF